MAVQFSNLIDKDKLLYFLQKLTTIFVRKEANKVLSDNNFTTAEKNKLDAIEAGAEVNTITGIKGDAEIDYHTGNVSIGADDIGLDQVDNTADLDKPISTLTQQALNAKAPLASPQLTGVPTAPTPNSNDNSTQIATTAYVQTVVASSIGGITGISFEVVNSLPATGTAGVFYLVSHSHGTGDAYDEYVWVGNSFEKIGNTDMDLSSYITASDITIITNSDIDTMFSNV